MLLCKKAPKFHNTRQRATFKSIFMQDTLLLPLLIRDFRIYGKFNSYSLRLCVFAVILVQLKFCNHCKKVFAGEFLEEILHGWKKTRIKKRNIRVFFHSCEISSPDVPAKTSVADMQNLVGLV